MRLEFNNFQYICDNGLRVKFLATLFEFAGGYLADDGCLTYDLT